jgi:hypothetical protein
MKVNVKCFAKLAKDQVCDYKGSTQYEMPEKSKVSDLIAKLGFACGGNSYNFLKPYPRGTRRRAT